MQFDNFDFSQKWEASWISDFITNDYNPITLHLLSRCIMWYDLTMDSNFCWSGRHLGTSCQTEFTFSVSIFHEFSSNERQINIENFVFNTLLWRDGRLNWAITIFWVECHFKFELWKIAKVYFHVYLQAISEAWVFLDSRNGIDHGSVVRPLSMSHSAAMHLANQIWQLRIWLNKNRHIQDSGLCFVCCVKAHT